MLLLWLYYFCISYVWYFYVTWLPTYMIEALHLDPDASHTAILGGLPLFFGGLGCFIGGWMANLILRRRRRPGSRAAHRRRHRHRWARARCSSLSTLMANPVLAMIAMGLSGFFNDLTMPGAWGACMDVGGKAAGSLSGSMNMMGNLGGALGPVVMPYLLNLDPRQLVRPHLGRRRHLPHLRALLVLHRSRDAHRGGGSGGSMNGFIPEACDCRHSSRSESRPRGWFSEDSRRN